MKKIFLLICTCIVITSLANSNNASASTNHVVPKAPYVSPSLKPCIAKYRQENYTGAMQDLETIVKKEKNNTLAKYYLALCYTRLGYKAEAQTLYKEVVEKDDNETLTHYSQRALDCLEDPNNAKCQPPKLNTPEEQELDDISKFIRSGKKIHPAAMDRITRERMERKLQESEYIRKQQEESQALPLKSDATMPTNEEIAAALNTLSKIGINPFNQNQTAYNTNNLNLPLNQINPMMLLNNNNMYNTMLGNGEHNPEITKMMLLNSLTNQQNNLTNYGI